MGAPPTVPRTLGDLLATRPLFVGREAELQVLTAWRSAPDRPVLALQGPGGVGKSALVSEMLARETGVREVHDLRAGGTLEVQSSPDGSSPPLVVVDEWDLDEQTRATARAVLARQDLPVKVLLVGRDDPRRWWPELSDYVQLLELGPLTLTDRCEYLRHRGVSTPHARLRVAYLLGGHPLSLTLMDALAETPPEGFRTSAQVLRRLGGASARILESVPPGLHSAVVAASLARVIDPPLLEAMLAPQTVAYDDLTPLPLLHAVDGGLAIAPVARRAIAEHAAWRDPIAVERMRSAGLRELSDRFESAPPGLARTMAAVDLHFLVRDRTEAVSLAAEEDDYGLRPGRLSPAELRALPTGELDALLGHVSDSERAHLWDLLELPGAWVTTAVDATGTICAVGAAAPLSQEGLAGLPPEHRLALGARALARHVGLEDVPPSEVSNLYVYTTGLTPLDAPRVGATMYAHIVELNLLGGAYLCFANERVLRVQVGPDLRLGALQLHALDLPASATDGVGVALAYDRSRMGVVEQVRCLGQGLPAADPTDEELAAELMQLTAGAGEVAALSRLLGVVEDDPDRRRELVAGHVARVVREDLRAPGVGHWLRRALAATGGPAPQPSYELRMFGESGVWASGARVPLGTGPLLAVTVLLAWHGPLPPDRVVALLWPDVEVPMARVRLRTTLLRIRKVAPGLLLRAGAVLRVGDPVHVDALSVLEQCDQLSAGRGDVADLLELLHGPILSGFEAAEWAAPILDELTVRVVATLATVAEDRQRPVAARLDAARRLPCYAGDDEVTLGAVATAVRDLDPVLATELGLRARAARTRLGLATPPPPGVVTPMSRTTSTVLT